MGSSNLFNKSSKRRGSRLTTFPLLFKNLPPSTVLAAPEYISTKHKKSLPFWCIMQKKERKEKVKCKKGVLLLPWLYKLSVFLFLQCSSWYISTLFGIYHLTYCTSFYIFLYCQAWFLSRPLFVRGWKEWCVRANKFNFTIFTEAFNLPVEIIIVNCGDLWFSLWIILHGFRTTIWAESMVELVPPQLTTFPKLDWSFQKRSLHTTAFSTFTVN